MNELSLCLSSFAQSLRADLTQPMTSTAVCLVTTNSTFSVICSLRHQTSDRKLTQPMTYKQPKQRPASSDNILAKFSHSYEGHSTEMSTFDMARCLKMHLFF